MTKRGRGKGHISMSIPICARYVHKGNVNKIRQDKTREAKIDDVR